MNTDAKQSIFAYGANQRVVGLFGGIPTTLSGFRTWHRGQAISIKEDLTASVSGWLYQVPVWLIDSADVGAENIGDYHRFLTQVFDGASYHDAWTYQLVEDADDYTRASSFTLNQALYEPATIE